MKTKTLLITILMLSSFVFAQNRQFSIGIIGSHFHNSSSNDRISTVDNPYSYGVIFSYQVDEYLTAAFSGEYFDSELENNSGTETDFRAHLSAYFTPISFNLLRPYLSAGLVYSNTSVDFKQSGFIDRTENDVYARYGIGIDIPLISGMAFNVDLGGYSNGLKFAGWSSSLGLRYRL